MVNDKLMEIRNHVICLEGMSTGKLPGQQTSGPRSHQSTLERDERSQCHNSLPTHLGRILGRVNQ